MRQEMMITRRRLLKVASTGAALTGSGVSFLQPLEAEAAGLDVPAELPEGTRAEAILDVLPGKKPLIKLTYRPPNYETPIEYFRSAITPNDAFYVRYHLSDIPQVDAKTWKLSIGGEGANAQAELTFDDLQKMPAFEIAAVNQCSGNRRGLFRPHVVGVQWGYGAMGCARWRGARLGNILDKVGVKKEAIEIVLDGADGPVIGKTPDFVKSIPVWKAMEETTIVAYEMNGQQLPHFNGFPARVIVPGWTGTYWMKHVTSINAVTKPFTGFWMNSAYRIPLRAFPLVERFTSQDSAVSTPITEMMVNSLITSHANGVSVKGGRSYHCRRHCLGRWIRHSNRRDFDGRRQDLGVCNARGRHRPLRLSHFQHELLAKEQGHAHRNGAGHEQDWPVADGRIDPQSRRLPSQHHAQHRAYRDVSWRGASGEQWQGLQAEGRCDVLDEARLARR